MSKLVLVLSVIGLSILLSFGIANPNSPVVWLASTSLNFAILRAVLIVVLVGLLFTHPPRNVYFRSFVGALSLVLVSWGLSATYENHMKIIDTMSLLMVSISAGLIALERSSKKELPFVHYQIQSR